MIVVLFYAGCLCALIASALFERPHMKSDPQVHASVLPDALLFGLCLAGIVLQRHKNSESED